MTVPTNGFAVGAFPLVPSVAVVSLFTGDGTTSILQWISSDGFVEVSRVEKESTSMVNGISYK